MVFSKADPNRFHKNRKIKIVTMSNYVYSIQELREIGEYIQKENYSEFGDFYDYIASRGKKKNPIDEARESLVLTLFTDINQDSTGQIILPNVKDYFPDLNEFGIYDDETLKMFDKIPELQKSQQEQQNNIDRLKRLHKENLIKQKMLEEERKKEKKAEREAAAAAAAAANPSSESTPNRPSKINPQSYSKDFPSL